MKQVQIPEPDGRFAKCPQCKGQPKHIESFGRTRNESMNFAIPAHRHSLECACGRTTARHATLAEAEAEWGVVGDQVPMPLPAGVTHIQRGRTAKAVRS